ncbi:enolase C-terminal domain-like protein, partial [Rhizobium ruizarguesonis]
DRPSDVSNNAKEVVARGFKAIKLNVCEEMQIVDTNEKVEKAVETIATIREAIGPHIGIGVEFLGENLRHRLVHAPMEIDA